LWHSASLMASTVQLRCGMRPPSSAMAASSALALKSASPRGVFMRVDQSDQISSRPTAMLSSAMGRCVPDRSDPSVRRSKADAYRPTGRFVQSCTCRSSTRHRRGATAVTARSGLAVGISRQSLEAAMRDGAIRPAACVHALHHRRPTRHRQRDRGRVGYALHDRYIAPSAAAVRAGTLRLVGRSRYPAATAALASLGGVRSPRSNRCAAAARLQSPRFGQPGGAPVRDRAATDAIGNEIDGT